MSDRLHEIAQHIANYGLDADSWFTLREAAAESLKDTGTPRIIRTVEELEDLDMDTLLLRESGIALAVEEQTGIEHQRVAELVCHAACQKTSVLSFKLQYKNDETG